MRLVDADKAVPVLEELTEQVRTEGAIVVKALTFAALKSKSIIPTVDAVPVVRCKDCRFLEPDDTRMGRTWCTWLNRYVYDNWWCADGETEQEENHESSISN